MLKKLLPNHGSRRGSPSPCDPQGRLSVTPVKARIGRPDICRDTFTGNKIAILGSGKFRHGDRHCVAPFVAEREQKEATYQRLLRDKHKWPVLERVKGIEPSYSAWKAAALPLSYTRAGVDLTRRAGGLNPPLRPLFSLQTGPFPPAHALSGPLNRA